MDEITLLDAVERYLEGKMTQEEKLKFEQLRKTNPEVDQLVVEQHFFLQQLQRYGNIKGFKHELIETESDLLKEGLIKENELSAGAKIINLFKRSKRTIGIAASIAGIVALAISALVWIFTPKGAGINELQELKGKLNQVESKSYRQDLEINKIKSKVENPISYTTGGTAFIVDVKGYLVTNAHVVENAKNIEVESNSGNNYNAEVAYQDNAKDIAILKINDENFKPFLGIPYSIRKSSSELAEPIFTLGYPRNDIVYGEGYLSASSGFNGDTLSCQIAIPANPGNSGSPVLNKNGEVIGILSTRQTSAVGVVFATHAKYIYQALDSMKKDTTYRNVYLPLKSNLKNLSRVDQVKKLEDCVFMVKVN